MWTEDFNNVSNNNNQTNSTMLFIECLLCARLCAENSHTKCKYVTLARQCWFVILFFLPSSWGWTWDLVFAWQMRYCKPYKISILVRFLLLWYIPWPKAICRRKGLFQLRWVLHYAVGTGAQGRNLKARTDSETIEEFCLLSYFPWRIHFVFLYHLEPSTHS